MRKQLLLLYLVGAVTQLQGAAVDYNGNPLSRNGSLTITPRTSSAILASYTQAVNLDGLVDQTFGAGGITTTPVGTGNAQGNAVAVQQDGKIVVAGYVDDQFAVARYTTAGILDTTTFGTNGIITTPIGTFAQGNAVAVQQDGKIVVAGYVDDQFAVARFINPFTLASFTASYGGVGLL